MGGLTRHVLRRATDNDPENQVPPGFHRVADGTFLNDAPRDLSPDYRITREMVSRLPDEIFYTMVAQEKLRRRRAARG
jgi:hypothetical protein